jgi:hypothetical protein
MNEDNEKPVVIQVHPILLNEFKIMKEYLEAELGYKIYGGMPIVSKIIGLQLREKRISGKQSLEFKVEKIKGEKKVKLII